jgi:hypothetical protein
MPQCRRNRTDPSAFLFVTVTADWQPFSNPQHNTTQQRSPAKTQVVDETGHSIITFDWGKENLPHAVLVCSLANAVRSVASDLHPTRHVRKSTRPRRTLCAVPRCRVDPSKPHYQPVQSVKSCGPVNLSP